MTKEFDERNAAKSRKVCEAMAEAASTGKRVLTECERQILAMWPRFEDGEYVWFGDELDFGGDILQVRELRFMRDAVAIADEFDYEEHFEIGERVKRLAPEVLDAEGVPIKVGDTVWFRSLSTGDRMRKATVTGFGEHSLDGPLATPKDEAGKTWHIDLEKITRVQPDSWERLEEDASKETCFYFGYEDKLCGDGAGCPANKLGNCSKLKAADIVRRAKALAGAEVSE